MIDILCPVHWSSGGSDAYQIITPLSELPSELTCFANPAYQTKVVKLKCCPCCQNGAISLLVNWIYLNQKTLFMDNPVTYCIKTSRLILSKSDELSLRQRWQELQTSKLVPLGPRRVGVGGRITEPIMSERIQKILGIDCLDNAGFSIDANAITTHSPAIDTTGILPDAVAFYSNALPEKITLKLEPTTRCNFGCEFCYGRYIEQGNLSMRDFTVILDGFPNLKAVELTGEGEPLVNHNIFEMLKICSERGLWTHITSNGSLLNEKTAERLLSTGLSSIAISLESLDPLQFARLRPGGKIENVLNAIRTLQRLRKERSIPLELRMWVTLLKETLPQVERIDEVAKSVGVDYLEFQALNPMNSYTRFYNKDLLKNLLSLSEMESLIHDPRASATLRSALASVVKVYRGRRCDIFMSTAMVNWQGNVTPCCLLKTPHFPSLGNLKTESFEEIWDRETYKFFRFALQHGVILQSCKECPDVASA